MKLQKNKGVALITVLLFMLVATIAATAVFKWVQAQNRASASRLKQNEAYQASLAGINVARSWLAFNGQETAALVTQFERDKTPIRLNSVLTPLESKMQQSFSVYLTNVDASNPSNVKLKIMSVGQGRNNSVYSHVAILGVNGLYKIKVPTKRAQTKINYEYAYFGGSLNFDGEHSGTSMLVNGDWSGNPGKIDSNFIVTGNVTLSGDKVEVGKTACFGGNMTTGNNGLKTKDLYVGGNAPNMDLSATGDAYFEGDVFSAVNHCEYFPYYYCFDSYPVGTKSDTVSGNMTLNGKMRLNLQEHGFLVGGNLCLTERGVIDFGTAKGASSSVDKNGRNFLAVGDVWIPKAKTSLLPSDNNTNIAGEDEKAKYRVLGETGHKAYINSAVKCSNSDRNMYKLSQCPTGHTVYDYSVNGGNTKFSSRAAVQSSQGGMERPTCAESVKDYCKEFWGEPKKGCYNSKYKVDDQLSTGYSKFMEAANKPQCLKDIVNGDHNNFDVGKLNKCYEASKNDESNFYNGYMVVDISNDKNILVNPSGTLTHNFIFVYSKKISETIKLPSTKEGNYVFLYLADGSSSMIDQSGNGPWNYFVYFNGNINTLKNDDGKPWNGSFYGVVGKENTCSKIEHINGGKGKITFDPDLMQDMIDAGIICSYGETCTPITAGGDDSNSEDGTGVTGGYDNQWIAYGPRVKINLASQYANAESFEYDEISPYLIVMPRMIYLPKGKKLYENNAYQYSVLYLGGAENPSDDGTFAGNVSCYAGYEIESGTSFGKSDAFTQTGLHTCKYEEYVDGNQLSSYFWVWVIDESTSTVVSFPSSSGDFACSENGETQQVGVNIANSGNEGTLKVLAYNTTGMGIGITANGHYLTAKSSDGYTTTYEFNVPQAEVIPDLFTMTMNDCENVVGLVQFQLVDESPEDLVFAGSPANLLYTFSGPEPNVQREEISQDMTLDTQVRDSLNNIQDCKDIDGGITSYVMWSAHTKESSPAGCKNRQSPSIGPWLCNVGETVDILTATGYDQDLCEVVQTNTPMVGGGNNMTYVYASLKARLYTLTIDIDGIKGRVTTDTVNAWHKERQTDDDSEYAVAVIDDYGKELGVCRTGGGGQCKFTTYAGGTYHLVASSTNFSHYSLHNDNGACTEVKCKTEWHYHKGIKRELVVVVKENTRVRANFTRTGYCFTEDFKHLHSYCSYDVTPVAYAGGETKWLMYGKGGWVDTRTNINKYLKDLDGSGTFSSVEATVHDFARGPQPDGSTAYCIDQCVTTKNYRYTGNSATGVPNASYRFYPTICSVSGNKYIPEDESVAYKEDQAKDYWSYWDPGEREYPSPKASNNHYACAVGKKASDPAIRDCDPATDSKHCIVDECNGPAALDMPRVRGGYYRPEDPYSPWMRVLGVHMSQNVKSGPIIGENLGSQWNTAPFVNRDQGYMTAGHGTTTPNVILRKEPAGYNGTYSKIFKIMDRTASYSWGSGNTFMFRSNPSATSFYHATVIAGDQIEKYKNVGVSANETRGSHILVCYCTNETCPAYSPYDPPSSDTYSRGWGSAVNLATPFREKGKQPYNDYSNSHPGNGFKDFWNIDGGTDNLGHCAVAPIVTNIPFAELVGRVLEMRVELDEDTAAVTLAYSSDISNVAGIGVSSYMVYSRAKFNLNDPELFGFKKSMGYKEEETPMYKFKHNVNGAQDSAVYVGFSMHDSYEQIYNIEWRSGGNCDTKLNMRPQIYCGFENNVAPVNKTKMPVYYVYDYCPDGAECDCDYSFTLNGRPWYGTLSEVRNYSYGELAVSANCRVRQNGIDGATRGEEHVTGACSAFTTYDPSIENSCTESYNIFIQREKPEKSGNFDYINLNESRISSIDRTYAFADNKVSVNATPNTSVDEVGTATNISNVNLTITCDEGSCEYAKNWYLKDASYYSTTGTVKIKELDGKEYIYPRLQKEVEFAGQGQKSPKLLKLGFNVEGAWHNPDPSQKGLPNESGVDTLYLKLRNKLGTPFLNLRDAALNFEFIQSWNMDTVQYWLQDNQGNNSPIMTINTNYGKVTKENTALYVGGDDGHGGYQPITVGTVPGAYGIPEECYSISRPSQSFDPAHCRDVEVKGKHYNCCQEGLAWWLDANGQSVLRRQSTGFMTSEWYRGITPNFDVERVSKIFFRLVNRNEAGAGETDIRAESFNGDVSETGTAAFVHVGNIIANCKKNFSLSNCQVNGKTANSSTKRTIFNLGEAVALTADVTSCGESSIASSIDGLNGEKPECSGMVNLSTSKQYLTEEGDQDITLTVSSSISKWETASCTQYIHVLKKDECSWYGTYSENYRETRPDYHDVVLVQDERNASPMPRISAYLQNPNNMYADLYREGQYDNLLNKQDMTSYYPLDFTPKAPGKYELRYGPGKRSTGTHTNLFGGGDCYVNVVYEPVKVNSCEIAEGSKNINGGSAVTFGGTTNAHNGTKNRFYKVTGPDGYEFSEKDKYNIVNVKEEENTFTYSGYKAPQKAGEYEVFVSFYHDPQQYTSCGKFTVSSHELTECSAPTVDYVDDGSTFSNGNDGKPDYRVKFGNYGSSWNAGFYLKKGSEYIYHGGERSIAGNNLGEFNYPDYDPKSKLPDDESRYGSYTYTALYGYDTRAKQGEFSIPSGCEQTVNVIKPKVNSCSINVHEAVKNSSPEIVVSGNTNVHQGAKCEAMLYRPNGTKQNGVNCTFSGNNADASRDVRGTIKQKLGEVGLYEIKLRVARNNDTQYTRDTLSCGTIDVK